MPRCRLNCRYVCVMLSYKVPHVNKLTADFICSIFPPQISLTVLQYYNNYEHHNSQGELQYYLCQLSEKPSYMSVCICFVDIWIPTYFKINPAFICFILPLQIILTVQFLNHYVAIYPSRRTTIPSKWVGRDAVLIIRMFVLCWHITSHIFWNWPRLHLYYFAASIKFDRITES